MVGSCFEDNFFHRALDHALGAMTDLKDLIGHDAPIEWVMSRDMYHWMCSWSKIECTYSSDGWCETFLYGLPVYVEHQYSGMDGTHIFPVIFVRDDGVFTNEFVDSLPIGTMIRHRSNILEVGETHIAAGDRIVHTLNLTPFQVVSTLDKWGNGGVTVRRKTFYDHIRENTGVKHETSQLLSLEDVEPVDISLLFGEAE